jgi:hypothetical protein
MGVSTGDGREPVPGGAARGAPGRRSGVARSPVQRSLPERQAVRALALGPGLRCPGYPHRDPAAHRRRHRQPCPAPRPRRVGGLRHEPDRLLRRRGDTTVLGAGPGAGYDVRVQCSTAGRRRGVIRGQRAGGFREDLGPSRRAMAQDLASGGVASRIYRLHLRGGHDRHGDARRGGRDGGPGGGRGGARHRLLLVGAAFLGRRPGELSGGDAGRGGDDRVPEWAAGLLRPGLRAAHRQERGQLRRAGHRPDRAVVADRRGLGPVRRPVVRALVPRLLAAGLGARPAGPRGASRREGGHGSLGVRVSGR